MREGEHGVEVIPAEILHLHPAGRRTQIPGSAASSPERPLAELDAEDVDPDLATPYAELERDYFRLVLEAHLTWLVRAEKRLKGMDSRSRRTKGASRKRR